MSSKRSPSTLEYFTKKVKDQELFLPPEDCIKQMIGSDFNNFSTSFRDEKRKTFDLTRFSIHFDSSSLSNINNFQENYDQSSNQFRFDKSEKPSTTDNSIPPLASTTNKSVLSSPTIRKNNLSALSTTSAKNNSVSVSSITNSLGQTIMDISKYDLNCCSSSKAYHPLKEDELISTTINKRSCQKKWFTDYPWLTVFQEALYTISEEKGDPVVQDSEDLTEKPILSRLRRPPRRYESNTIPPPDGSNDYIKTLMDFCHDDIYIERLKSEAFLISDFFRIVINTNQMKIKLIAKISTVCEIGKQMFQEFDKLIRLYLTITITTATSERAFSALN
ncbi:unnamed protein product [Rotaria sordida]|nr:unnamed protein product [Rotaria sordida]